MKIFVIIFSIINLHSIYAQFEEYLECRYMFDYSSRYLVHLKLSNPYGRNDFKEINGTHLDGFSYDDVQVIDNGKYSFSKNIPSILCSQFRNAQEIIYPGMLVQNVNEDAFTDCVHLLKLTILDGQFTELPENLFFTNIELQYIAIGSYNLAIVPENIFINQHFLEVLNLGYNQITDMPGNIFRSLRKLKQLYLPANKIADLKVEWFESLENLESLFLDNNEIQDLPVNVFSHLTSLTEVHLYKNRLKVIYSDSFGTLIRLNSIRLDENEIIAVDEKLIDNTRVNSIDMTMNFCADKIIVDNTVMRLSLKMELAQCFKHYENLVRGET